MWKLDFHTYGRSGRVNGQKADVQPDEVFIVGEVLAETQALATAVSDTARVATIVSLQLKSRAVSTNLLVFQARTILWTESHKRKFCIWNCWFEKH
jgi:hypothetical protein